MLTTALLLTNPSPNEPDDPSVVTITGARFCASTSKITSIPNWTIDVGNLGKESDTGIETPNNEIVLIHKLAWLCNFCGSDGEDDSVTSNVTIFVSPAAQSPAEQVQALADLLSSKVLLRPKVDQTSVKSTSNPSQYQTELNESMRNLKSCLPFRSVSSSLPLLTLKTLNLLFSSECGSSLHHQDPTTIKWEESNVTMPTHLMVDPVASLAINLMPNNGEKGASSDSTSNVADRKGDGRSVFDLLNKTVTKKMGEVVLNSWVQSPSTDLAVIKDRHDAVEYFVTGNDSDGGIAREKVRSGAALRSAVDLFSISKKLRSNKAGLKDLYECYLFCSRIQGIVDALRPSGGDEGNTTIAGTGLPNLLKKHLETFESLGQNVGNLGRLAEAVIDMNLAPREFAVQCQYDEALTETSEELDSLMQEVEQEHARIDQEWSERTGAKLNSVRLVEDKEDGGSLMFRLPDTNAEKKLRQEFSGDVHVSKVLKNGVHFNTEELRSLSASQAELKQKYKQQSRQVVSNAMEVAKSYVDVLTVGARACGELDCLASFAHLAATSGSPYVRPTMTDVEDGGQIELLGARHPCVEVQENVDFIPNDYVLTKGQSNFQIITGPNMGGKSTYIRGCGCIIAMAQIGSFVPCDSATINIVDAILARVGAGDAQQKGISTFMAEMLEASSILQKATKRSLIIIDELGRGTSTFDGYGLAWSISEYLVTKIGCSCLFATHFHELTAMEEKFEGVKNCHVSAATTPGSNELVFLYSVEKGPCLQSFGIQVAELASIPKTVINEAKRKAKELEAFDTRKSKKLLSQTSDRSSIGADSSSEPLKDIDEKENIRIVEGFTRTDFSKVQPSDAIGVLKNIVSP